MFVIIWFEVIYFFRIKLFYIYVFSESFCLVFLSYLKCIWWVYGRFLVLCMWIEMFFDWFIMYCRLNFGRFVWKLGICWFRLNICIYFVWFIFFFVKWIIWRIIRYVNFWFLIFCLYFCICVYYCGIKF